MRLRVTGRYRSTARVSRPGTNGVSFVDEFVSYEAGDVIDVADEVAEFLMRDSPGTFVADNAMSTETATGIVANDRRARGGRVR